MKFFDNVSRFIRVVRSEALREACVALWKLDDREVEFDASIDEIPKLVCEINEYSNGIFKGFDKLESAVPYDANVKGQASTTYLAPVRIKGFGLNKKSFEQKAKREINDRLKKLLEDNGRVSVTDVYALEIEKILSDDGLSQYEARFIAEIRLTVMTLDS